MLRKSHVLLLCIISGLLGYGLRRIMGIARGQENLVAVVNGEKITYSELERALGRYKMPAIRNLVYQHLVAQRAADWNISVSPKEVDIQLQKVAPEERPYAEDDAKTQILRSKLILSRITEEELKQLHQLFLPELRRYDLSLFGIAKGEEAVFKADCAKGLDSAALRAKYTYGLNLDPAKNILTGVTRSQVKERFGPFVAAELDGIRVGALSPPVDGPAGRMAVRIESAQESYADLKPDLERIVVEGNALYFDFELARESAIYSPYALAGIAQNPELSKKKKPSYLAQPKPGETPIAPAGLPSLQPEPGETPIAPGGLPSPKPVERPTSPAGLPSVKTTPAPSPQELPRPTPQPKEKAKP